MQGKLTWIGRMGMLLCLILLLTQPGRAEDAADWLAARLADAAPGTVIPLPPGDYGTLSVRDLAGTVSAPITLRGEDPADPPRFSRLTLNEARHVVLEHVHLAHRFTPGDPGWLRPFRVIGGGGIIFRHLTITGDDAHGEGPGKDGFPTAYGLSINKTDGFRLEDSEINGFARGLVVGQSRDLVILRNDLHDIRSDGMNFVEVTQLLVEDNLIHDFRTSPESGDHPDMIQFWTTGTASPSTDVTIRGNILNSGQGGHTQTIFMRNEEVDNGRAGPEMFYRNITIEDNVILNAHLHGITVGETDGLIIRDNAVLHNALSDGEADNPTLWTPRINVSAAARNVRIERNLTFAISGHAGQADWRLHHNYLVQDRTRAKGGFYGMIFADPGGDPRDLASFTYKEGGPLDGVRIGPNRLWRR